MIGIGIGRFTVAALARAGQRALDKVPGSNWTMPVPSSVKRQLRAASRRRGAVADHAARIVERLPRDRGR